MIDIRSLSKNFGDVQAVRELDLHVPRGELFCFLGPNGAGKTTTIKVLTGLLKPTSGEVRVAEIDITRDPVAAKKRIGYIPDMPFLYDRLTPTEFYTFTGDLYGVPQGEVRSRMEDAFSLFGLQEQQSALIRDLSHGMRQRLIYAAVFLHDPEVLFIDEPLIGLDPYTIRLIKDLLVSKVRAGMTIFLTTHILALAEDVADRIGIISRGSMIALGTLAELRKNSSSNGNLEEIFLGLTGQGNGE